MPKPIYAVGFVIISLALIGGQLLRFSIGGLTITALDLTVVGWAIFWLGDRLVKAHRYPVPRFLWWGIGFVGVAIISLIGALRWVSPWELTVAFSYLARWTAYAMLVYLGYALAKSAKLIPALGLVFGLISLIGISQWLIAPDLSFLERLGWDPHQGRLVSTFLDPNFVGGFLVIGLSLATPQIFIHQDHRWRWYWIAVAGLNLIAIYLTFSRSALLSLLVAVFIIGALKYRRLALYLVLALVLIYLISPKLQQRIMGALVIDQTARYRIESWNAGLNLMKAEPWLGVGFNTLPTVRDRYGYWPSGHASSGFDSSLLTIGATTGGFGLLAYLGLLGSALLLSWRKWRTTAAPIALSFLMATGALLVNSLFINSLLYPSILTVWWIILGLVWAI